MQKDTMTSLLIRHVRPYGEGDTVDVLVEDGCISRITPCLSLIHI